MLNPHTHLGCFRVYAYACVDVCACVHIHDGSRLGVGYLAYGRVVIAFSLDTGDILDRFVGDSIDPFVSRYVLHFCCFWR
jgi:hypothetical protein